MGQILHGSAKTTPGVKGESKPASARPLARWVSRSLFRLAGVERPRR